MNDRPWWRWHASTVALTAVGLLVAGTLAYGADRIHEGNERRLLAQRGREAAALIAANIPTILTPLVSATELAEATDGDADALSNQLTALVTAGERFVSASIWRVDDPAADPVVVVGNPPTLLDAPTDAVRAVLDRARRSPELAVFDLTREPTPALGYAVMSRADGEYVAYVERVLPPNRTRLVRPQDAFANLDSAVYLGDRASRATLLTSSTEDVPFEGAVHAEIVEFGDATLRVEVSPVGELGGALLARLWWLLLASVSAVTLFAAVLVERLARRRDEAATLAEENRRLYAEQREVAQTLQRSLLPDIVGTIGGLEFASFYAPAETEGADIGGDWYDAVRVDEHHVVFAVGDVSGRGLHAATIMAAMRYAIRAYALQGLDPATILAELGTQLDVETDGHFATVVCGRVDLERKELTLAIAGHPRPLVVERRSVTFADAPVGPPVGVSRHDRYETATLPFAPGTTLVAFTDGLFERRGELIDTGLERLRAAAEGNDWSTSGPRALIDGIRARMDAPAQDDTAMLGVAWTS